MWRLTPHGRPALITKGRRAARRRQPDQGRPVRPARPVLAGSTGLVIGSFPPPASEVHRCVSFSKRSETIRTAAECFSSLRSFSSDLDNLRYRIPFRTRHLAQYTQCNAKPRRPPQGWPVRPARPVHPRDAYRRTRHHLLAAGRGGPRRPSAGGFRRPERGAGTSVRKV